jgi:hypothetical protein
MGEPKISGDYLALQKRRQPKKKQVDAYKAANRMAKLAPVVSLAQTCAGGNQSAFEATAFSNLLEHEEYSFTHMAGKCQIRRVRPRVLFPVGS